MQIISSNIVIQMEKNLVSKSPNDY